MTFQNFDKVFKEAQELLFDLKKELDHDFAELALALERFHLQGSSLYTRTGLGKAYDALATDLTSVGTTLQLLRQLELPSSGTATIKSAYDTVEAPATIKQEKCPASFITLEGTVHHCREEANHYGTHHADIISWRT